VTGGLELEDDELELLPEELELLLPEPELLEEGNSELEDELELLSSGTLEDELDELLLDEDGSGGHMALAKTFRLSVELTISACGSTAFQPDYKQFTRIS